MDELKVDFEIQERPGRGRCAIAKQGYQPGDIIIQEEPYAFIVTHGFRDYTCCNCCKFCINEKMFATHIDDKSRYCSENCILKDNLIHTKEIEFLLKLDDIGGADNNSLDTCRLIIRIAAIFLNEHPFSDIGIKIGKCNRIKDVLELEACRLHFDFEARSMIIDTVQALEEIIDETLDYDDIEHLIFAIGCNAHQIVNYKGDRLGLGLFPMTSMLNHSCTPNSFHYFEFSNRNSPKLIMKALKPILPGEEICYSYVNLYQCTQLRRKQLLSAYGFDCSCSRCEFNEDILRHIGFSIGSFEDIPIVQDLLNLQNKLNIDESESDLFSLLDLLSSKDISNSISSPCHISLFKSYVSILDFVNNMVLHKSDVYNEKYFKLAVAYGVLALGCIAKLVQVREIETSNIESKLSNILSSLCKEDDSTCATSSFSMYWFEEFIFKDDPRVFELVMYSIENSRVNGNLEVSTALSILYLRDIFIQSSLKTKSLLRI